jgi:heme exporter protein D
MNIWWNNWSDFLTMGQHGVYVWGSYGLAVLLALIEIIQARRARQQLLLELQQEQIATHTGEGP